MIGIINILINLMKKNLFILLMIKKKRKDVNYTGYTFNRDNENMKDGFIQALEILEVVKKILKIKKEIMMMIIIFFFDSLYLFKKIFLFPLN